MKQYRTYLLALAVTLMSGFSLLAATSTWDGDTDSFWTTALNWDTAPTGGKDIVFPSVANQTVDLAGGTYNIATLTFNSPNAYSLGNGALTLGGDVQQNGGGAVTLNVNLGLGGASRGFGGSGSGVVTFNNPVTGDGYLATLNGGNWVIANNANTIDRWVITGGAIAKMAGSGTIPRYNDASIFGGNGGASVGGYYVTLDGGTLDFQVTEPGDTPSWGVAPKVTATMGANWSDRAIIFGPNGGTLIWTNAAPGGALGSDSSTRNGPSIYYSQGGTGTIIVGQPLPYSGDFFGPSVGAPTDGTNQFRSPFEVEYGFSLGIYQNSSLHYTATDGHLKWRQGWGDIEVVLTNGASAYLDWNVMTNGNLIIKGQPGGDSAVIETNATGWTRNVGRFAIRGPHRGGVQYSTTSAADAPAWAAPGVIDRSFYMDQPNGMKFYDAVQVWNRDGGERLACDMSFESGSSVDFCGARRNQALDLGHYGNTAISGTGGAGPTNLITIKSNAKLNLNLQLRSQYADGATGPCGYSAGLRVFSLIDIKDGGQLKIYRSQNNCFGLTEFAAGDNASLSFGTPGSSTKAATKCIELFRPITGEGSSASDAKVVIDLPWSPRSDSAKSTWNSNGKDGVNFEANSTVGWPGALPIVNGSGDYGLRVEGKADYLTNFLYTVRLGSGVNALAGLTGSGGTFTVAVTDGGTLVISNGPSSSVSVALGIASGSNPKYVLEAANLNNFSGLVHKGGTAVVRDGTTVTMKTLKLAAADATIQLGEAAGSGAVLNFDNSSNVVWTAGTLTISNWNGSASGGGADQVKFGTDATGLTAGQLAQIQWINPNGGADVTGASILANGEIVPYVPSFTEITSPAIVNGEFVFNVAPGVPGQTSVIQWATNLTPPIHWVSVLTNTGAFSFTNAASLAESYYRVLVQ